MCLKDEIKGQAFLLLLPRLMATDQEIFWPPTPSLPTLHSTNIIDLFECKQIPIELFRHIIF